MRRAESIGAARRHPARITCFAGSRGRANARCGSCTNSPAPMTVRPRSRPEGRGARRIREPRRSATPACAEVGDHSVLASWRMGARPMRPAASARSTVTTMTRVERRAVHSTSEQAQKNLRPTARETPTAPPTIASSVLDRSCVSSRPRDTPMARRTRDLRPIARATSRLATPARHQQHEHETPTSHTATVTSWLRRGPRS
jgi:hypothetical protein